MSGVLAIVVSPSRSLFPVSTGKHETGITPSEIIPVSILQLPWQIAKMPGYCYGGFFTQKLLSLPAGDSSPAEHALWRMIAVHQEWTFVKHLSWNESLERHFSMPAFLSLTWWRQ